MTDTNKLINPETGRQWDTNSLIDKVLELTETMLQQEERTYSLSAQVRELERMARDAEDLKVEHDNLNQLLTDKSRENKHVHQELSRMNTMLSNKIVEVDELKSLINDLQHQLKTCQSERYRLEILLTEAENSARQGIAQAQAMAEAAQKEQQNSGWFKNLRNKQSK